MAHVAGPASPLLGSAQIRTKQDFNNPSAICSDVPVGWGLAHRTHLLLTDLNPVRGEGGLLLNYPVPPYSQFSLGEPKARPFVRGTKGELGWVLSSSCLLTGNRLRKNMDPAQGPKASAPLPPLK